jgi:uncharacterized protein (TIGR02594 family)
MEIVRAEEGVTEYSLPGQHNKRIIEYHSTTTLKATTDETAWCSSFVNWVMKEAGYRGTKSAAAKSWLDWGVTLDSPRVGAIIVVFSEKMKKRGFTGFHVTFWLSASATHVKLLGGNQGNFVKESNYPLSEWEIKGYRWPS